jgi:two-component system, cell cycle response regulator
VEYADVQAELATAFRSSAQAPLEVLTSVLERHQTDQEIYAKLVASLINVSVAEETARVIFHRMLKHHQKLVRELGRPVDFRVSVMDFTVQHPELIESPVVVEQETLTLSQRLAAMDELTGLFNRRFLDLSINKELTRARRYGLSFSVLFIDLDDFKSINDSYGHDVGDRVLATLGRSITTLLRSEDFAGRYGGEEFVVLLPQTDSAGAVRFADRLQDQLTKLDFGHSFVTSFSGGVATYPDAGETVSELLRHADAALYKAKLSGKQTTRVFTVEKRRGKRHPIQVRAACQSEELDVGEVEVQDVSRTGLAARAHRLLAPGARVRFRFSVTDESGGFEIVARVVWSRKMNEDAYQFGGAWTSEDSELIETLVTGGSR